jgi:hypothetical protein
MSSEMRATQGYITSSHLHIPTTFSWASKAHHDNAKEERTEFEEK